MATRAVQENASELKLLLDRVASEQEQLGLAAVAPTAGKEPGQEPEAWLAAVEAEVSAEWKRRQDEAAEAESLATRLMEQFQEAQEKSLRHGRLGAAMQRRVLLELAAPPRLWRTRRSSESTDVPLFSAAIWKRSILQRANSKLRLRGRKACEGRLPRSAWRQQTLPLPWKASRQAAQFLRHGCPMSSDWKRSRRALQPSVVKRRNIKPLPRLRRPCWNSCAKTCPLWNRKSSPSSLWPAN